MEVEAEVLNDEAMEVRSAMSAYMADIAKIAEITKEELTELGEMLKVAERREYAKQRLVEGNLKLVVKMAFKFKGNGLGIDDLIAEGNCALMSAVEKYDTACGDSFSTYAMWWIRTAMSRAIDGSHTVRIPTASALAKRNVERFKAEYVRQYGKEPTFDEIKEELGLTDVKLRNILQLENACVSMNAKLDNEDGESDEVGDLLANETVESVVDTIVKNEEVNALYKALKALSEVERTVIVMRYGMGGSKVATLDEVALKIGKTKERVRQIQTVAEQKLLELMSED